jgi:chromate reductase, NAD(P)H dehydrogenase (quinone)
VPTLRILAISGSLRAVSSNTAVLRAARALAPENVDIHLYGGLGDLPPFNPDLDGEGAALPPPVADFRAQVAAADGILLCSPEYAHGVPGALKNALDWLVSGSEIIGKPVASVNAAPWSTLAQASLLETLRVMSTNVVAEASIALPVKGGRLDEATIVADPEISAALRIALAALVRAIESRQDAVAPR